MDHKAFKVLPVFKVILVSKEHKDVPVHKVFKELLVYKDFMESKVIQVHTVEYHLSLTSTQQQLLKILQ